MRVRRLIIEIRLEWRGDRNDKKAFAQTGWLEFLVVKYVCGMSVSEVWDASEG